MYACAGANGVPAGTGGDTHIESAIKSSENVRTKLEEVAAERQRTSERVEKNLAEMNKTLDSIIAKLRGDDGTIGVIGGDVEEEKDSAVAVADSASVAASENVTEPTTPVTATVDTDDDVEPYTDPSQFGLESTAGWQVLANSDLLPSSGTPVKFRIECDGAGCSLIEMDADAAPGPGVRQPYVQKGRGFRVGYDPDAPESFCAMLGNEHWLLALDKQEIKHFKRLVTAVARKMARIDRGDEKPPAVKANPAVRRSGDGMFSERVLSTDGAGCSVEMESKLMWVQAVGKTRLGAYALRVIFMEKRQSEGYWEPEVVPGMLVAVAKLEVE